MIISSQKRSKAKNLKTISFSEFNSRLIQAFGFEYSKEELRLGRFLSCIKTKYFRYTKLS